MINISKEEIMESISSIMTKNPASCFSETSVQAVAELMIKFDCGEIPVLDSKNNRVIGIVTDRDICCRTIGKGLNPLKMTAGEIMSFPVTTIQTNTSLDECCKLMEKNRIRRVPVVDAFGRLVGVVSTADIANKEVKFISEVMQEVSKPKSISIV